MGESELTDEQPNLLNARAREQPERRQFSSFKPPCKELNVIQLLTRGLKT